jgi:hypothetical protein
MIWVEHRPSVQLRLMDTIPDPELPERPTRHFTAAYKVAIVGELDEANEPAPSSQP